jgi:hypothetical protein
LTWLNSFSDCKALLQHPLFSFSAWAVGPAPSAAGPVRENARGAESHNRIPLLLEQMWSLLGKDEMQDRHCLVTFTQSTGGRSFERRQERHAQR